MTFSAAQGKANQPVKILHSRIGGNRTRCSIIRYVQSRFTSFLLRSLFPTGSGRGKLAPTPASFERSTGSLLSSTRKTVQARKMTSSNSLIFHDTLKQHPPSRVGVPAFCHRPRRVEEPSRTATLFSGTAYDTPLRVSLLLLGSDVR